MPLSVGEIGVDNYFFPQIYVEANSNHDPTDSVVNVFTFEEDLNRKDDEKRFTMSLTVRSDAESSENPQYTFFVSSFGSFTLPEECGDIDEAIEVGSIVARRILMGAVREQIATLTSRGPWDTVILRAIAGLPAGTPVDNDEPLVDIEQID